MFNESLLLLITFVDILFVFFAARMGLYWLYGTIAVNLILVTIFGAKLITVFELTTNVGNAFYACVFLATYFILERNGKYAGLRVISYGAIFLLFFISLSILTTILNGSINTSAVNDVLDKLFNYSTRIVFASLIAYIFAQYVNVMLYEWLKVQCKDKNLWLRSNGANIVSQLVDSLLFFTIAFYDLPGPLLVQAILLGWVFKIVVVLIGTPFLYLDSYLVRRKT